MQGQQQDDSETNGSEQGHLERADVGELCNSREEKPQVRTTSEFRRPWRGRREDYSSPVGTTVQRQGRRDSSLKQAACGRTDALPHSTRKDDMKQSVGTSRTADCGLNNGTSSNVININLKICY
jgi:hypothetical protein